MRFSLDPGVVIFLLAAAALYVRAVLVLRERGWRVGRLQQLWWWIGWTLQAIAPQRRRMRGELWKIPYIFASRMVSMFLGVGLVVSRHPLYHEYYGNRPRAHGISPLVDTQVAGGLMMTLDMIIIGGALIFFFWRASQDADRAEDAERAARATATPAT